MKNCYLCLLAIVSLLGFLSCSKDDATEMDARNEVKVTATFNGLSATGGVTTRAVDSSWEVGDAIGLFMKKAGTTLSQSALANNVEYTTGGDGAFTSLNKVYFPFKKEYVDFISYYPYTDNLNGFIYEVDVSDQSNLASIDLMYADKIEGVNSTTGSINLQFKHQLTKVVIKLSDTLSEEDLTSFDVKITNANTKASFLLSDGTLTDKAEPVGVHFYIDKANKKAEAILLPDTDLTNKEFIITVGGISYSYPLKNSEEIKFFAASTKCVYNITLESNKDRVLQGVTAEITDWETITDDGTATETEPETEKGDDPTPPAEGDGTQEKPYTIAQTKDLKEGGKFWIKGFIVGSYSSTVSSFTAKTGPSADPFNIALADLLTEKSFEKHLFVHFDLAQANSDIRKGLNLQDKPGNLGREVSIFCDIGEMTKLGGKTFFGVTKVHRYSFMDE